MRIHVTITTFNRPDMLRSLLDQLVEMGRGLHVMIDVFDDGSSDDYSFLASYQQVTWHRRPFNGGKSVFWQLLQYALHRIQQTAADYHFSLQDDVQLVPDFFQRAIEQFEAIDDPRKICLNLHWDPERAGQCCWTGVRPRELNFGSHRFQLTQWTDLLFMARREFFEALHFQIWPLERTRWHYDARLSSGVGEQFSRRLHRAGFHLYQVSQSLVNHGEHPTQMHRRSLSSVSSASVVAGLATIPSRADILPKMLASLLPQVDALHVYLNGFTEIPDCLRHSRIQCYLSQDHAGDLNDAGKFWGLRAARDYYVTVDDDLIYPPDYVATLIHGIEQYHRRFIVGVHGIRLRHPFVSYYQSRQVQHFAQGLAEDWPAHVLGTGTVAFHVSTIRLAQDDFSQPGITDIWLGLAAQRQHVGQIAIARPAKWLGTLPTSSSLYQQFRRHDERHTAAVKSHPDWRLWGSGPDTEPTVLDCTPCEEIGIQP